MVLFFSTYVWVACHEQVYPSHVYSVQHNILICVLHQNFQCPTICHPDIPSHDLLFVTLPFFFFLLFNNTRGSIPFYVKFSRGGLKALCFSFFFSYCFCFLFFLLYFSHFMTVFKVFIYDLLRQSRLTKCSL